MVRLISYSLIATAAVFFVSLPVNAADLPLDPPPLIEEVEVVEMPPEFDWTGFYAGAFVGYGWSENDAATIGNAPFLGLTPTFAPSSLNVESNGLLGGLNAGYNQRINRFVVGVEGDIALTDMEGAGEFTSPSFNLGGTGTPAATYTTRAYRKYDYFGTLRGRVGFLPSDRLMVFGTAGLAFSQVETEASFVSVQVPANAWSGSDQSFKFGWTAGAGAEYMATERLSIKLDGLYFDLGDSKTTAIGNSTVQANPLLAGFSYENEIDNTGFVGRLGVNYHF